MASPETITLGKVPPEGEKEERDVEQAPETPLLREPSSITPSGIDNPVFTFENVQLFPPSRPMSKVDEIDAHVSSNGSLVGAQVPNNVPHSEMNNTSRSLSIPNSQLLGVQGNNLAARRGHGLTPVQIESNFHPLSPGPIPSPGGRSIRSTWSELMKLKKKDSSGSFYSDSGSMKSFSGMSSVMSERLKELRRKFTSRTEHVKERTQQPPTPSSLSSSSLEADVKSSQSPGDDKPPPRKHRLGSLMPGSASGSTLADDTHFVGVGSRKIRLPSWMKKFKLPSAIDPQSKVNIFWLFIVTIAFMYNAWVVPLRFTFVHIVQKPEYVKYWLVCDYFADFLYIMDIVVFAPRIIFINNGVFETDPKAMRKNYWKTLAFKLDVASLAPLDLLYFIPVLQFNSLVRLPRLLKVPTFWMFYDRFDQAARSGHVIRITKTMTYMVYLIHVEACGYYWVSSLQGFSTTWTYREDLFQNVTAYIRCFYVATKTATSIGKNPIPTNDFEYTFMIVYWLSGVVVFALLIGQIRDIFEAAGAAKSNYRKTMDITLWYMQSLNLPKELQGRVRMWFNYNWDQQKTLNENSLIESLPMRMKTDLAINVHFQTLTKVQLFQDCDKNLLYDLILKLKPVLYLPGDYICRKGEVGIEMYIVMSGQVQVVGGLNNDIVFATLHEGSVFGEISLLALAGGNRRTADVRSKGFSNLFLLSKADFEEAMSDYPAAQALLKKRAKKLLSQNKKHEKKEQENEESEEIIRSREPTPKMVKAVIQILQPTSKVGEKLLPKETKRKKKLRRNKVSPAADESEKPTPQKRKLVRSITDELQDDTFSLEEEGTEEDSGNEHDSIFGSDVSLDMDAFSQVSEEELHLPGRDTPLDDVSLEHESKEEIVDSNIIEEEAKSPVKVPSSLEVQIEDETSSRPVSKLSKDSFNHEMAELIDEIEKTSQSLPVPSIIKPKIIRLASSDSSSEHISDRSRNRPISAEVAPALIVIEKETPEPQIPKENRVTCDVEIHREKTPSMSENFDGIDNPAFCHSESYNSLKNVLNGKEVKEEVTKD